MPYAEHRQCARHIYANFRKKFNTIQFRNLFWAASKATYPAEFEEVMEDIKKVNIEAFKYLMGKDPSTRSMAFFQTERGCDAVENGISECFNSIILDARRRPIITMLESIRVKLMERMSQMREVVGKWPSDICPVIKKRLEQTKELQRFWQVIPAGGDEFEVKNGINSFSVKEGDRTCSCRLWQLRGLPCQHAMAALSYINKSPEDYVLEWFRKKMFTEAYNHYLKPLNGMKMWPNTNFINPLPPKPKKMTRRPKIKRRRDVMENNFVGSKVKKTRNRMRCTNCQEEGHNRKTCNNPKKEAPQVDKRPPGKKKTLGVGVSYNHSTRNAFIGLSNGVSIPTWPPRVSLVSSSHPTTEFHADHHTQHLDEHLMPTTTNPHVQVRRPKLTSRRSVGLE